jgi:hypothetical protein
MAFLVAGKYIKLLLYSKRASIHVVKCTAVAYIYALCVTLERHPTHAKTIQEETSTLRHFV